MLRIGFLLFAVVYYTSAVHQNAVAVLQNKEKGIYGQIFLEAKENGVLIHGNITGLTPGKHGFHVHEKGDISDPKCVSTGGHYNPFKKNHGAPEDEIRHVGDLGNIVADKNGVAIISIQDSLVSLTGPTCVLGRAIVLHEKEDDLGKGGFSDSLTTGHAGSRLACGVIGLA